MLKSAMMLRECQHASVVLKSAERYTADLEIEQVLTEVDSRLERPAMGGTLPSPLPPDVSGYAVFDLSGWPPPRMLSAVKARSNG